MICQNRIRQTWIRRIRTARATASVTALALLGAFCAPMPASADNQMGYQLQTAEAARGLTRAGGSLGMKVGPEKAITSGGMTFELLKVEGVGAASPAAQAGLSVGDQIIAVDGRVFPDVPTFAAYVGSVAPGRQIQVDYMPANGGPQQAQRVGVTVGEGGHAAPANRDVPRGAGLSTGDKVAIGVGAAAVFGCYEAGCFSRLKKDYDAERETLRQQGQQQQGQTSPKP